MNNSPAADELDEWYATGLRGGVFVGPLQDNGRQRANDVQQYLDEVLDLYERSCSPEGELNASFHAGLLAALAEAGEKSGQLAWQSCVAVQSVVESLRRCRDAKLTNSCLRDLDVSVILAGSVMYGRFYSVLQQRGLRASDLDLVVIVHDRCQIPGVLARLSSLPFVDHRHASNTLRHFARCWEEFAAADLAEYMAVFPCWTGGDDEISCRWNASSTYELSVHVCAREDFGRYILPFGRNATTAVGRTFRAVPAQERPRGKLDKEMWSSYTGDIRLDQLRSTPFRGGSVESRLPFLAVDDVPYVGRFLRSILPRLEVLTLRQEHVQLLEQCIGALTILHDQAVVQAGRRVEYDNLHPHRHEFSSRVVAECGAAIRPRVRLSELSRNY